MSIVLILLTKRVNCRNQGVGQASNSLLTSDKKDWKSHVL